MPNPTISAHRTKKQPENVMVLLLRSLLLAFAFTITSVVSVHVTTGKSRLFYISVNIETEFIEKHDRSLWIRDLFIKMTCMMCSNIAMYLLPKTLHQVAHYCC